MSGVKQLVFLLTLSTFAFPLAILSATTTTRCMFGAALDGFTTVSLRIDISDDVGVKHGARSVAP
jgi:hypothetical protein